MRLRRAFSQATGIPWLVFLWGAAEIGERVEYIADKEHRLWRFAMSPMGGVVLVVLGLVSIIGVIVWPEVKRRFLWIKIPPSDGERLARIEGDHEKIRLIKETLDSLEKHRLETIESTAKLEHQFHTTEKTLRTSPWTTVTLIELSDLIREAADITETFWQMRGLYGEKAVTMLKTPFSGWRPTNLQGEAIPSHLMEPEKWARSLHVRRVADFYRARNMPEWSSPLFSLVTHWIVVRRDDISYDDLLRMLNANNVRLIGIRSHYAANLNFDSELSTSS